MNPGKAEPTSHSGKTNSWYTPRWIIDAFPTFDLDPCGDERWSTADCIYETDGLQRVWFGNVWLNPPYGREVGQWTDKLVSHGKGVALLFGRTDTLWFQRLAPSCSWIFAFHGRVKFVNSQTLKEAKFNPGAPSILCAVGPQPKPSLCGVFLKPEKP